MKTLTLESYKIARYYEGTKLSDSPALTTLVNNITPHRYPLCSADLSSAFVTYCVLLAAYRRSSERILKAFKMMKLKPEVITLLQKEVAILDSLESFEKPLKEDIILPPFSAFGKLWQVFGKNTAKDPRRGDVVVTEDGFAGMFYDYHRKKGVQVIGLFKKRISKCSFPKDEITHIRRSKV